jgi:peptide/nickel transport system substrate-binding protein
LTGHARIVAISLAMAAMVASGVACRSESGSDKADPTVAAGLTVRTTSTGGDLRVSLRSDPQSFNWITRRDSSAYLVTLLTQAWLVRVNRLTDTVEPWLAESWSASPDGLRYTIKLRQGVTFADGAPFTSDDVVFSLAAAYDEKGGSMVADSMRVGGKNLTAEAVDPVTVVITFPGPFGPGLRLFDNLPILPRHKLRETKGDGWLANAWRTSANPAELTGLGPFVLTEYTAGQRLVFARNPRYFRKDANGLQLPLLDRVVVEIVSGQDAELLRLQAGQSDLSESQIRLEDYAPVKRAADEGRLKLYDVGTALSADSLWFNLKPGAFKGDPRAAWIQRDELRQAISLAVDRKVFIDTVYLGAAVPVFGPVTPGNKAWYAADLPQPANDPAKARALLASIGLTDRNGDGRLEDAGNRPARFTILTVKGQTALERGVAVVRDELTKIGLAVDTVPLDANALVGTFLGGKPYDAVYFSLIPSDTDPALNLDFWLSSGGSHLWNPEQKSPATSWERQLDQLMAKQAAALDAGERRKLFTEVQRIFLEHAPMLYFAAPRIYVATSARVLNIDPMLRRPQALWSPDTIALRR